MDATRTVEKKKVLELLDCRNQLLTRIYQPTLARKASHFGRIAASTELVLTPKRG